MKEDALYLAHINTCIRRIESYTQTGREEFLRSTLIQDAVIRNFVIMGEAAKRLSQQYRAAHADVPWRHITGFRDILIHDYLGVSLERVWQTITSDLPRLKNAMKTMASTD